MKKIGVARVCLVRAWLVLNFRKFISQSRRSVTMCDDLLFREKKRVHTSQREGGLARFVARSHTSRQRRSSSPFPTLRDRRPPSSRPTCTLRPPTTPLATPSALRSHPSPIARTRTPGRPRRMPDLRRSCRSGQLSRVRAGRRVTGQEVFAHLQGVTVRSQGFSR